MRHPQSAAVRAAAIAATVLVAACQDAPTGLPPDASFDRGRGQEQMAAWFNRATPEVLALPGAVFVDHDEASGRLLVGVANAAAIRGVQSSMTRLGIPGTAYAVQVTEPIYQLATLRDVFRPTQGGIQIHFSQYVCTLGFNVTHSAGRSFITNSHCTARQGGTEGTVYYQPASNVDGTVIATEAADPEYFKGGICPRGKKCRYSDAARALYSSNTASTRGAIAKTTGANNGSLTVSGNFTVTGQDNGTTNFPKGTVVNKVGRTTGWSSGQVTNSCVHTSVQGSQVVQLCQTFVSARVGGGDSGSPVFRITSGDNVTLVGILWGGSSSGNSFVFSPLKQIQDELGAMTATQ
ncbi:MAG TPA: hypothetical protein VK922_01930 [Gemmatimonadaceae bacterium]|nr:hypothetical protein [Gemmatimonadaceae bacterium]